MPQPTIRSTLNAFIHGKLQDSDGKVSNFSPLISKGNAILVEPESQELLAGLGLRKLEFAERYIKPFRSFSPKELMQIAEVLKHTVFDDAHLLLDVKPIRIFEVLRWTIAQVHLLLPNENIVAPEWDGNILIENPLERRDLGEGFWEFVYSDHYSKDYDLIKLLAPAEAFIVPIFQCWICGQMDRDKRGKPFRKNSKTCHVEGCNSFSSDMSDHKQGCCFLAWRKLKKTFYSSQEYYKNNSEKSLKKFNDICEKQYLNNLNILHPIRAAEERDESSKFFHEKKPQ
ncbi:hypothetical protein [Vampirovibrio sp.]|uniref:hypothetical protein n=1 Tax=Vampirovibrio sp. TaxID=2717857 RepID=UPI0035947CF2